MAPGSLKECHIVVLNATSFRADYTPSNLKKWIESAGGYVAFKEQLTELTTHLVIDEATWIDQGPFIREILRAEAKGSEEGKARVIHIVSFDWLQECLDKRIKRGESSFKWKKLAGNVLKNAARSSKQQGGEQKEPGNVQGLMAQAFLDSTETFVDVGEKKRIEKRKRQEAEDRAEELEEQKRQFEIHRKKMSVPEQAEVFRKGAKRARHEILSDNHHIYQDSTGFTYDVAITKVDFNNNVNERYVLTIYESNTEPSTYAFNCSFGGTKVLACNDIIVAIGSNFPTAFRAFKKVFREKTQVNWNDRILAFNNREANARIEADDPELPFEKLPFEYYPPKYGPLGELPLSQTEAMEAAAQAAKIEREMFRTSPKMGDWKMRGANGWRDSSPGFDDFMTSGAKGVGIPQGGELEHTSFDYPFPIADGGKDNAIVLEDDGAEDITSQHISSDPLDAATLEMQLASAAFEATTSGQASGHSHPEFPNSYEFDGALDLTQYIDFPGMDNEMSQIPSPSPATSKTQAFAQTQLTNAAREELLSNQPTQSMSVEQKRMI